MNNPIIHDQSNALRVGNPLATPQFTNRSGRAGVNVNTYRVEDREVRGAASGTTQRTMGFGTPESGRNRSLTNGETHGLISYQGRANTGNPNETWASLTSNQTGRVDMQGYMSWLRQHGYAFAGQREREF